jgi:hypothetical protein
LVRRPRRVRLGIKYTHALFVIITKVITFSGFFIHFWKQGTTDRR